MTAKHLKSEIFACRRMKSRRSSRAGAPFDGFSANGFPSPELLRKRQPEGTKEEPNN
jgi:hypothetical protein